MGAVYTEVSIAIYNIMTELAREIGPRHTRYPQTQNHNLSAGRSGHIRNILQKNDDRQWKFK